MILASLGGSSANVALPALAQTFGATFQQVQWVILAYLLAVTTLVVSAGRLGDLIGRRRLLLIGLALFVVGSLFAGLAPSLSMLVAARALQGIGGSVIMALTLAFVGDIAAPGRTGAAMGLLGTMSSVGTAAGPFLGGLLIAATGWRSIFLLNIALGAPAFFLAYRFLPRDPANPIGAPGFDKAGTLLLGLALAAYALATTLGRGQFGVLNIGLLGVAIVATGVFLAVERRAPSPLVDMAIFSDRALSASLGMSVVVSTVAMGSLIVGPFYLALGLNLNPASIGLVLATGPIVAAFCGVPAGRLVDRLGARNVMAGGLAAMATGCVGLGVAPLAWGVPGYVTATVLLTMGYAFFQASNNTAIMSTASSERRGAVSGILNLARNLGLISGASLMGAVFAAATGISDLDMATANAIETGFHRTFLGAGLAIAAAFLLAVRSARLQRADDA